MTLSPRFDVCTGISVYFRHVLICMLLQFDDLWLIDPRYIQRHKQSKCLSDGTMIGMRLLVVAAGRRAAGRRVD